MYHRRIWSRDTCRENGLSKKLKEVQLIKNEFSRTARSKPSDTVRYDHGQMHCQFANKTWPPVLTSSKVTVLPSTVCVHRQMTPRKLSNVRLQQKQTCNASIVIGVCGVWWVHIQCDTKNDKQSLRILSNHLRVNKRTFGILSHVHSKIYTNRGKISAWNG